MALTLQEIRGRVLDTDSHEMIPASRWGDVFGERGRRFRESADELLQFVDKRSGPDNPNRILVDNEDDLEITQETVWAVKGTHAPSAIDMSRRHAVLDEMGVSRALVFSAMGINAWVEAHGGGFSGMPVASPERQKIALDALDAYTDWAIATTTDRARIPGVLVTSRPGMTPEMMARKAEEMIRAGLKAIHIGTGHPPAGLSPADPAFDKFYAILAEANVALVTHPPSGMGVMSDAWSKAAPLLSFAGNVHMAEENFTIQMVLGGVFERHPKLRFGAIECGADWIGPLAERLDKGFGRDLLAPGKARPSEYLNRNVRVSAVLSEEVEVWLERYPQVQNCYCYSSDFPHREGEPWSLKKFYERVSPLGSGVVEKFFCTNGQLLLP